MRRSNSTSRRHMVVAMLLASSVIAAPGAALAQDPAPADPANQPATADQDNGEIIVTAQKRSENLQKVPMAITAITTKALDDLQVNAFEDYARLVPSLSTKASGGGGSSAGAGSNAVYFRGVASGENGNHSSSLPSVGTYLDEQPITTINGALDVHVFDMARIEALAGPQGTLYGASSQAGTIRLISNKPDVSATYGEINLELNKVAHGGFGYTGEGFLNTPLSDNAALRVVGWHRHDAGFIDNIRGTMYFSGADITIDNDDVAEDDYNDVDTTGARAALKIDLDENWTVTPAIMGQTQRVGGNNAEQSGLGDYEIMQFNPESAKDRWVQAALTVEGKVGSFDMTYAGAYMKRRVETQSDYSDYSYFYDALGSTFFDNNDNLVNPNQRVEADHHYSKLSQELRFLSPSTEALRLVAGLFYQRQVDEIREDYVIDGIADSITVPGTESDIWLTRQDRVDRDYAVFGELSYDITPQFTLTAGGRLYKYDNSLVGFFGFSDGWSSGTGVAACFGPSTIDGAPCTNVDKRTKGSGFVHRLNATWKPSDQILAYATWSKGFRPGGVNRRGTLPPYKPDYLNNYEIGVKYNLGRGAHLNFAGYREDWDDVQLSFLGENGLSEIRNAGNARIWGFEADLLLKPAEGLTWSTGFAYNDAKLRNPFCTIANPQFDCSIDKDLNGNGIIEPDEGEENAQLAPAGRRMPLTAKLKGSTQLRYEWPVSGTMKAHVQALATYEGKRTRDLRIAENAVYGNMPAYTQVDLAAGIDQKPWSAELYVKNLFDTRGQLSKAIQCLESTCGATDPFLVEEGYTGITYTTIARPRTIGLRAGYKF